MPKARKTDWYDDLTAIFSVTPVWLPLLLAITSWLVVPILGDRLPGGDEWADVWTIGTRLGSVLFIVAGIAGQVQKLRRRRLIARAHSMDGLRALSWRGFEELCAEAYRRKGHAVTETARGADGGVDLVLGRGSDRVFVQCKHYADRSVGVRPVRELYGVMAAEGARAGIVITSGSFTHQAMDFARGKPLTLVDGRKTLELVEGVSPSRVDTDTDRAFDPHPPAPVLLPPPPQPFETGAAGRPRPTASGDRCKCGGTVVDRKRGSDGAPFLGCSRFPACRRMWAHPAR